MNSGLSRQLGAVPGNDLAVDTRSLDKLKGLAAKDQRAALKEAAKQFEAIFMQQIVKSMRQASVQSGLVDGEHTAMSREMLDTQWANKLAGMPGGLSLAIERQLSRQLPTVKDPASMNSLPARMGAASAALPAATAVGAPLTQQSLTPAGERQAQALSFLRRHDAAAKAAEAATGVPATFILAQAAHESSWGHREIRQAGGDSSHNLFGIKAGPNWKGATTEVTTTEYVNGEAQKVKAKFRAYGSYEEAFKDYAKLISENPRYAKVMQSGSDASRFAQGLQKAGYATDPAYANKLQKMINHTLRLQRMVV